MALLAGQIQTSDGKSLPYSKFEKFKKHEWQPRGWEWVDPQKDMQAKLLAVNAGLIPPQDLAEAMGYNIEDNLRLISEFQALAEKFNVKLPAYDSKPGVQETASGDAPADPPKKKPSE